MLYILLNLQSVTNLEIKYRLYCRLFHILPSCLLNEICYERKHYGCFHVYIFVLASEHLGASRESLLSAASPVSVASNGGVYAQELLDNVALNLHRIDKDVQRCDRNYAYFTIANLDKLRNIMCT